MTTWDAETVKTWALALILTYIHQGRADRAFHLAAELAHFAKRNRN